MNQIEKLNERRKAEKRAEFLLEATLKMAEGRETTAMSLLLAAIEVYSADYRAVRLTIENWIANGQLPKSLRIPDTVSDFKEMCKIKYKIEI